MKAVFLILSSFILGSIPFGVLVARVRGIDLKKVGSGNIGATNVLRTMGKGPALFTLLGDILKGSLAVAAGKFFFHTTFMEGLMGLSAILGHTFSPFLGFKGGKGVATSIGVLLVYSPTAALITIVLWITVIFITRYSSLGALISFGLLPVTVRLVDYTQEKLIFSLLMAALLIVRHTDNIKRLIKGTESVIGKRS